MMLALTAVMALSVVAMPQVTFAQAGGQNGVGGGLQQLKTAPDSGIQDLGIQQTGREGIIRLIAKIISYALYVSGAIAVLFVIVGGYRYLTAGGNEEGAKKGRTTVVNALIGLVIIILAYVIVSVIVNFIST